MLLEMQRYSLLPPLPNFHSKTSISGQAKNIYYPVVYLYASIVDAHLLYAHAALSMYFTMTQANLPPRHPTLQRLDFIRLVVVAVRHSVREVHPAGRKVSAAK